MMALLEVNIEYLRKEGRPHTLAQFYQLQLMIKSVHRQIGRLKDGLRIP
jgi:hypothetical protein